MTVAIVIPAFNEAGTIGRVVQSVLPFGVVIVVDDASGDATASIATQSGAVVVRHPSNRGYEGALQSGFERAMGDGHDIVVTFDADGQHDPSVLGRIVGPLRANSVDLVIGVRPHPARWGEGLFGFYTRMRFGVPDILCGLKGYSARVYRAHGTFDSYRSVGTELALAALRNGARFTTVPVPIHQRADAPRFGRALSANLRIIRALLIGAWKDLTKKQ